MCTGTEGGYQGGGHPCHPDPLQPHASVHHVLQQDGVVGDGAQLVVRVAVGDVHAVALGLQGGLEWAPATQGRKAGCTHTHTHKTQVLG